MHFSRLKLLRIDESRMIRVLIVDNHPLQRKLLTMIFSGEEDIVVAGEAESGEEALQLAEKNNFDVIILDIELPQKSGFEVFRELGMQGKEIPVIIVSGYPREEYESAALAMGVSGYIAKQDVTEKLVGAIRDVAQNK